MLFFLIFTKGILAKPNELESESDIFPQNEGQNCQIWIGHFQWALTNSALYVHFFIFSKAIKDLLPVQEPEEEIKTFPNNHNFL